MTDERCFACDRRITGTPRSVLVVNEDTTVFVGPDCYRKVKAADQVVGYQPPRGGPRLALIGSKG